MKLYLLINEWDGSEKYCDSHETAYKFSCEFALAHISQCLIDKDFDISHAQDIMQLVHYQNVVSLINEEKYKEASELFDNDLIQELNFDIRSDDGSINLSGLLYGAKFPDGLTNDG